MNLKTKIDIPVVYAFIYKKLKEKNRTNIVHTEELKERIGRAVIKCGGLPRCLIKEIIKDLERLGLIKRINHFTYEILPSNCVKKINKFIWN